MFFLPPNDPWGFTYKVLGLVGEFGSWLFGLPTADEGRLRSELAVAWDDLGKVVEEVAQTAADQVPTVTAAWDDFAGGAFASSLNRFAGGGRGGVGDVAAAAHQMADSVRAYADKVEYTRTQALWEIAINIPIYAATFMTGPAGWALGALARWAIERGTARVVSGLLEGLAARAAASTFPQALALTPGQFVKGIVFEVLDEETTTIPALIQTGMFDKDPEFARNQILTAATGAALGEPISHVIGKPFGIGGHLLGRGLDRIGAPKGLQRHASIFVESFGTNSLSSPISSKMANDLLSGNYANLLNVGDYGKSIENGWLSSGAHGTLRANGVHGARELSQVATNELINTHGSEFSTFKPPPPPPPPGPPPVPSDLAGTAGAQAGANGVTGTGQGAVAGAHAGAGATDAGHAGQPGVDGGTHPGQGQQGDGVVGRPVAAHPGTHAGDGAIRPGTADHPAQQVDQQHSELQQGQQTIDQHAVQQHGDQQQAMQQGDQQPTAQQGDHQQQVQQLGDQQHQELPHHNQQQVAGDQHGNGSADGASTNSGHLDGAHHEVSEQVPVAPVVVSPAHTAASQAPPVVQGPTTGAPVQAHRVPTAEDAHETVGTTSTEEVHADTATPEAAAPVAADPVDGNAAKVGDFVANGPVRENGVVLSRVEAELRTEELAKAADVRKIEVTTDGNEVVATVTPYEGDVFVVRFAVGEVSDQHPGAYRLSDGSNEFARVVVSNRVDDADIGRTAVHEIRELASRAAKAPEGPAFNPHQQGRIGELRLLHDQLNRVDPHSDREAWRAAYAAKMREAVGDLNLEQSDTEQRLQRLRDVAEVRRALDAARDRSTDSATENAAAPINAPPTADVTVTAAEVTAAGSVEAAAHQALVARMNELGADGKLTPAAQELRQKFYTGGKKQQGRRGLGDIAPDERTFTVDTGNGEVEVKLPWVWQTEGVLRLETVVEGQKVGEVQHVPFTDPVLKVSSAMMAAFQRLVNAWQSQFGQSTVPTPVRVTRGELESWSDLSAQERARIEEAARGPHAVETVFDHTVGGELGEDFARTAENWLLARHPGERIYRVYLREEGESTFDQVYARIHPESRKILGFVVIEAKNPHADLGARLHPDGEFRYAQGHREYVRSILEAMIGRTEQAAVLDSWQLVEVTAPTATEYADRYATSTASNRAAAAEALQRQYAEQAGEAARKTRLQQGFSDVKPAKLAAKAALQDAGLSKQELKKAIDRAGEQALAPHRAAAEQAYDTAYQEAFAAFAAGDSVAVATAAADHAAALTAQADAAVARAAANPTDQGLAQDAATAVAEAASARIAAEVAASAVDFSADYDAAYAAHYAAAYDIAYEAHVADGGPRSTTVPVRPVTDPVLNNSVDVGQEMLESLDNGSLEYFAVRAELDESTGLVRPKGIAITEYDMSPPGAGTTPIQAPTPTTPPYVAGASVVPGDGAVSGQVASNESSNRAEWSFGRNGQSDEVVLQLREVHRPGLSPKVDGEPQAPYAPRALDWAFSRDRARGLIPPGVAVNESEFRVLEVQLKRLIRSGQEVTVRLRAIPGANGLELAVDVSLVHPATGRAVRYGAPTVAAAIDALSKHPAPPQVSADQNASTPPAVPAKPAHTATSTPDEAPTAPPPDRTPPDRTPPDQAPPDQAPADQAPPDQAVTGDASRSGAAGYLTGVAKSVLWFSGAVRLVANYRAVELAIHRALADPDVRKAAGFASIELVPGTTNLYDVTPVKGTPFQIRVRAAHVDGGHPGRFAVRADGTEAASITVSDRSADASVARTLVNLLHQLDHAGRPSELAQPGRPAVRSKLRTDSEFRDDLTLTREDGGRLAELRFLDLQAQHTPQYRAVRRANVRNEMRALLEYMGVANGQQGAKFRWGLLGADRDLVARRTEGWEAGDGRPRGRVYVTNELVAAGTTVMASVGIVIGSENFVAGLGLAVPAVITAFVHAHQQRKLDGAKQEVADEQYGAHLDQVAKRNPGVYELIESDPFGAQAAPRTEIDATKLTPAKQRYRTRHLTPSAIGLAVSALITGISPELIAPTLFYAASALIRPVTDRMADARNSKKELQRFEELMTKVATDPLRYENQLIEFLQQLQDRLRVAIDTIDGMGRTDATPGSLDYGNHARKELAEQVPGFLKRLIPGTAESTETDPTELSKLISVYGESLIFGAINGLAGAATAAWVNAYLQQQNDAAVGKLFEFSLKLRDRANSNELHQALREQIAKTIDLVQQAERLAAGPPADAKLMDRVRDRLGLHRPDSLPTAPNPAAPLDPADRPDGQASVWSQTLTAIPPAVSLAVVELSNLVLGFGAAAHIATVLAAATQLLAGPVARMFASRQDALHAEHALDTNNELAVEQQMVADKLGAVRFLRESIQAEVQARADGARPAPSRAANLARTVELLFRTRATSPDYTAGGSRVEGDPLARAQARVEEGWRRLHGEPDTTPMRVLRLIVLNRIRQALRTLTNHLAVFDANSAKDGVEEALSEFRAELAKFKELQQQAGVPGDLDFDPTAVADQVQQRLAPRRPDGNAAKLRHFVADGVLQNPRKLLPKLVAELKSSLLHEFADVRSVEVRTADARSGAVVVVTTHNGDELVIRIEIGEVADGHPGEFRLTEGGRNPLTGEPEHAVVRISDRINDYDVGRAVVHELRELSHPEAAEDGAAFSPHQQGRLGELLYLHDALARSEADLSGDRELRRRLNAAKFRDLVEELELDHPDTEQRLARLKDQAEVRRALDAQEELQQEFGAPAADPVVSSHQDLVASQGALREQLRAEAERNGTSLDHEYRQFALRQMMARTLQHTAGAWAIAPEGSLLTGVPGANQSELVEAFQAALRLDHGDHLRFDLTNAEPLRNGAGTRLTYEVQFGDQLIGSVSVYLVPHTAPIDWTPGNPDFGVSPGNGFDPAFHHLPLGDAFAPGVHDPEGAFKGNERPIAEKLAAELGWRLDGRIEDPGVEGQKDPECMVRKGPDDPGRIMEFKTLDPPKQGSNPGSAAKRNVIDASHQVPPDGEIVIDLRNAPELTEEDAERAFRRALGQGRDRVAAQVHFILGDGRIVTFVKET